jgi:hypothetical protein
MFLISKPRLLLYPAVMLIAILGVLIVICPPALFPDPSWGFQVMRCMQQGGGFNLATTPNPADISKNVTVFLTWWSPGQYLLPYGFVKLLGLNGGHAAGVTIIFCDLLGILGFYTFFKKVGFSKQVAALSIAFIACQQFFFIPYVFYNGGETLLFGFLGWFLYGCFCFNKIDYKLIGFVLLSGWVGFFCKSAFLWMYAAGMLCLWVNLSAGGRPLKTWLINGLSIGVPAAVSLLTIYKLFLSKGSNPATASKGLHFTTEAFGFPLASPLLSGFSFDDMLHGLIYHADKPLLSAAQSIFVLIALALISMAVFIAILRLIQQPQYKLVVAAFYGVSCLFFFSVFLRQLDISYEGRHFRIVGLLFIPGVLYFFTQFRPAFKVIFLILWGFIGFTSLRYFIGNYKYNVKVSAHGPTGFSQLFADQQAMDYLQLLDGQHHNDAVFVFTSADLGLEIMHNRMITLDAPDDNGNQTYVADNEHDGYAGPLYILLPAYYITNGNALLVEQAFPAYRHFEIKQLSKNYVVVSGLK